MSTGNVYPTITDFPYFRDEEREGACERETKRETEKWRQRESERERDRQGIKFFRFSLISKNTEFEDNKCSYSFNSFSPPFKASSYKTVQKRFQVPNIFRKLGKEIFGKDCII